MSIEISEERGVRYLHFGTRWIQGAMRVARPWALELEYTRDMMLALLLRPSPRWPASALLIGLGAASLPKYLYRNRPRAALTVVEIDAAVVDAAAQYFKLPEDPRRLAIEIADGHDYVTATDRRYDLIVVDGYDAKCRVGMLDTLPFYCACRARLSDSGLLVTNFLNRHRGLGGSLKRMDGAFGSRVCALPACSSGNIIALAATGSAIEVSLAQLKSGALALKRDTGLNLLPIVARIARLQAGISDRFVL
ncbi:MAG: fused MFS/spermidine synthase [Casimicrobiaceae bacterium]